MIIRGTQRPASSSPEAGRACLQGDPACNTRQGCTCFNPKDAAPSGAIPVSVTKTPSAKFRRAERAARKAAVENSKAMYIELECGHLTTREMALLFDVFGSGTSVYCDIHDDFYQRKPKKAMNGLYPDVPLF